MDGLEFGGHSTNYWEDRNYGCGDTLPRTKRQELEQIRKDLEELKLLVRGLYDRSTILASK